MNLTQGLDPHAFQNLFVPRTLAADKILVAMRTVVVTLTSGVKLRPEVNTIPEVIDYFSDRDADWESLSFNHEYFERSRNNMLPKKCREICKKDPKERPSAQKLLGDPWVKLHDIRKLKTASAECKSWVDELLDVTVGGSNSAGSKRK